MPNKPIPLETTRSVDHRDVGVTFIVMLLLSIILVGGYFGEPYLHSLGNLNSEEHVIVEKVAVLALFLGSAVALVLAVAAIRRIARGRWRRSWQSSALTVLATLNALPGLCMGSLLLFFFIYSILPLSDSERRAIEVAEKFVERNGYTSAGHPKDLPVLQNDIMDGFAKSEEGLVEMRKGTLQANAIGINLAFPGFYVYFESAPPRNSGFYRVLEVHDEGDARMLHQNMSAGWFMKAVR